MWSSVRCSHCGSIGNCARPSARQPFIYIATTTKTTLLLVLLRPGVARCAVEGEREGRGRMGVETVRFAGFGQRTRTGMTKWSRGLQGVEATRFCGFLCATEPRRCRFEHSRDSPDYCNTLYFTPPAGATRISAVLLLGLKMSKEGSTLVRALL